VRALLSKPGKLHGGCRDARNDEEAKRVEMGSLGLLKAPISPSDRQHQHLPWEILVYIKRS
jgi:hypothetical protein